MNSVVGRTPVLTELTRLRRDAAAGGGAFLLLAGEAGIGKSTLLAAFSRAATDDGLPVLAGRCVADEGAPAFWPIRTVLDRGTPFGLSADLLDLAVDAPPATARFVAVDRTVRALVAAAGTGGLVVTLDDLQWADAATLALLRHLHGEVGGTRLLVVGTAREVTPALDELRVPVLRLGPLTVDDVAACLGAEHVVHASWPPVVWRRSGGNPLFVRELARLLVAEGRLGAPATDVAVPAELRRMAGYRLDRLGPECRRLVGAAAVIGEDVDVALLASVMAGGAGPARDAAGSTGGAGAGPLLAEAVTAGVLLDDPDTPDRLRFAHALVREAAYDELPRAERLGWHDRTATALEALEPVPARAGEIARHRVRAVTDRAGRRHAVEACRAAAAAAGDALDFAEAAHWYRRAVELIDGAGYGPDRLAAILLDLAVAAYRAGQVAEALHHCGAVADLAERLGRPVRSGSGAPSAESGPESGALLAARAAIVVRGIDGPTLNDGIVRLCERARALLGDTDSALHAQVLAQQAVALTETLPLDQAVLDRAEALSRRAMVMAERFGDACALVDAMHARSKLAAVPDGAAERLDLGLRLRALGVVADRPESALWAHVWRLDSALQLGAVDVVDAEIAGLATLVDRLRWPLAEWQLLRARGVRAQLSGQFALASGHFRAAMDAARRTQDFTAYAVSFSLVHEVQRRTGDREFTTPEDLEGLPIEVWPTIALGAVGAYRAAIGDLDGAARFFQRLKPGLAGMPRDNRWIGTILFAGEMATALGDPAVVAFCYDRALPYAADYCASLSGYHGTIGHLLGTFAYALGDLDAADRHLTTAATLDDRIGAVADLAMDRVLRAQVLLTRGAPGDRRLAGTLAEDGLRAARRLGMRPTADRAAALLDDVAGVRPDSAGALTPREREIATFVATGLSNRAIADRLVLSERTVETHVRNLLSKLELTNRTQVAAWAVRAGLRT